MADVYALLPDIAMPTLLPVPKSIGAAMERQRRAITPKRQSPVKPPTQLEWSYGVTTVPSRITDLLPRTLASLQAAGFDRPRLFVDGAENAVDYERFGLPVTTRFPKVLTPANWVLSMTELYYRSPDADRFALFQDDFVCCLNLREYLNHSPYPEHGYLNLFTFPKNESVATGEGWYRPLRRGLGAVGLVFSRDAVLALLGSGYLAQQIPIQWRRRRCIDGTVSAAMRSLGYAEYVHYPSLVQHAGLTSSMGNPRMPLANSFPGEAFDAMSFRSKAVMV